MLSISAAMSTAGVAAGKSISTAIMNLTGGTSLKSVAPLAGNPPEAGR
jgi:hypothetical protein